MAAVAATAPVSGGSAAAFTPGSSSVKPREAFFDARGGVTIRFRFEATGPTDVSLRIAGEGREVRRQELKQVEPGAVREFRWDGLTEGRKPAPNGRYRVLVGTSGSDLALAGRVTLRGHRHPVPRRPG